MTRKEVVEAVVDAVAEVQGISGRACPKITASTKPIGDVPGFDSLNALEATIVIMERLGVDVPEGTNIFVSEAGDSALSVNEVARCVTKIAQSDEGPTHDE